MHAFLWCSWRFSKSPEISAEVKHPYRVKRPASDKAQCPAFIMAPKRKARKTCEKGAGPCLEQPIY
jgi:hypothetical protein